MEYKNYAGENSFAKWLRRVAVRNTFSIIVSLIIFILAFELGNFWLSMKIASGLRAYVAGEGLWSKAQKAADNSLLKYSTSLDESDYQHFLALLEVPLGDKKARLELDKKRPDFQTVKQGYLAGGNDPEDLSDLIFLYRHFRRVSYMDRAIAIWTEGDALIGQLEETGKNIHAHIQNPPDPGDAEAKASWNGQLQSLTQEVGRIDRELTVLENNFSATLGEGSRRIRDFLLWSTTLLTILLGGIVLFVSSRIRKVTLEVDRAKSEFVSLASHQLRSPITVIKWQASRLLESLDEHGNSADPGILKKFGNSIYTTAQRMIELVNAILNVSKIDLGTLAMQPQPTSMTDTIEKILEELDPEIRMKNLHVSKLYPAGLPRITIDPNLARIIILNLLTNAIKYTPDGGQISVNVQAAIDNLLITVADSGCGISPKDQGKIFNKFFRTETARQIDPNGNGLGMYIVRAIVREIGGGIWLTSRVGMGTSFYVRLPFNGTAARTGVKDLAESRS